MCNNNSKYFQCDQCDADLVPAPGDAGVTTRHEEPAWRVTRDMDTMEEFSALVEWLQTFNLQSEVRLTYTIFV